MLLILYNLNHAVTSFPVHIWILTTSVCLRIYVVCVEKPVIAGSMLSFYFPSVPSLHILFSCRVEKDSKSPNVENAFMFYIDG
jgi:hypothetical protein